MTQTAIKPQNKMSQWNRHQSVVSLVQVFSARGTGTVEWTKPNQHRSHIYSFQLQNVQHFSAASGVEIIKRKCEHQHTFNEGIMSHNEQIQSLSLSQNSPSKRWFLKATASTGKCEHVATQTGTASPTLVSEDSHLRLDSRVLWDWLHENSGLI